MPLVPKGPDTKEHRYSASRWSGDALDHVLGFECDDQRKSGEDNDSNGGNDRQGNQGFDSGVHLGSPEVEKGGIAV